METQPNPTPPSEFGDSLSAVDLPSPEVAREILRGTVEQIKFARKYTLELLEHTPRERWFEIPEGLSTHIAWQVGHLTISQYGLLMFRLRGRQDEDLDLIPSRFRKAYSRGSKPSADTSKQLSADELIERMATIHQRSLEIVDGVTTQTLLEPIEMPFAAYPVKLGSIMFCPLHEHIHAGQMGLIRRSLQLESIR